MGGSQVCRAAPTDGGILLVIYVSLKSEILSYNAEIGFDSADKPFPQAHLSQNFHFPDHIVKY